VFCSAFRDPQGYHQHLAAKVNAIDHQHHQIQIFLAPFAQHTQLIATGRHSISRRASLKKTITFHPDKIELAKLKYDTFLDYCLSGSHLECHRGYLRVDDYYVKVLTLKEPSAQSFPLIFKRLPDVSANYYVVTE
jgi:hypothetical protein